MWKDFKQKTNQKKSLAHGLRQTETFIFFTILSLTRMLDQLKFAQDTLGGLSGRWKTRRLERHVLHG